jgi:hypothetical protein
VQGFPTPSPEDSPKQEEEHGEYHGYFEHGADILYVSRFSVPQKQWWA